MNKGKKWTFEEIESNRAMYDSNKPLLKNEVLKLISEQEGREVCELKLDD